MPRTRSLAWSELKLGVLTIVAFVIATVTVIMLTGSRGFFWQQYTLKTRFDNVAGLKPGSPVRIAGIPVGTVNDWKLVSDKVEVTFSVNKEERGVITDRSVATLGSISLLGESSVDITPASGGTPIPDDGYVQPGKAPAQIADITEEAGQGIQSLNALVTDVRNGRGTVGKLMTDDAVYDQLRQSLTTVNDIATGIKEGKGAAGKLLADKATADELDRSLKNLESLTEQLSSGKGSLGVLLNDDSFAKSLTSTTESLQSLVAKINSGQGTAGKLVTDSALYDKLDATISRVNDLITQLNQGQGTMGQLLKDRQLYENMNRVTTELAQLIAQIEKDPSKYLRVKVSIF